MAHYQEDLDQAKEQTMALELHEAQAHEKELLQTIVEPLQ